MNDLPQETKQPPQCNTLDDPSCFRNNYYRLKIIDRDGKFKYSDIVVIKVNRLNTAADGIVSVYPNPTNDKLNIVYQSSIEQSVHLNVYKSYRAKFILGRI